MIAKSPFAARWQRFLARALCSSVLVAAGFSINVSMPGMWTHLGALRLVSAQVFTEGQLRDYAQAVLDMEERRQQAYKEIKTFVGGTPPTIACNDRTSYRGLPRQARKVVREYCRFSAEVVRQSGLSVAQFNAITNRANTDMRLEKQIQEAMLEIRLDQRRANQKSV